MGVIVKPLPRSEASNFVWSEKNDPKYKDWPKFGRNKANTDLPSLVTAYVPGTDEFATWGFRTRRTSHTCEITWWGGDSRRLLSEALKGCVYTAILEGRKRVECYNEQDDRPDAVGHALGDIFEFEGEHPDFTDQLVAVKVYGHVWLSDDVPVLGDDTTCYLVENKRVNHYKAKNLELYAKDIDLHRENKDGRTFAALIEESMHRVKTSPRVHVLDLPEWHGKTGPEIEVS